ncbi:MAG: hypothetical protein ER33_02135 [Cyanobium sp. CACIAM 14]|nr:MAG: hypothetical protein ER33_02135 [Cyanobium sp. CACIAM 14]
MPCTALELPAVHHLIGAVTAAGLRVRHQRLLRFSRPHQGGLAALRHLRRLGADASPRPPLAPGELRRLLAHWPRQEALTWEVLLLLGRRETETSIP